MNAHTTNFWYGPGGSLIKRESPDGTFQKSIFDGLGRTVKSYLCYEIGETGYSAASGVSGDVVIEQSENIYDKAGNLLISKSFERFHDAPLSGTGDLTTANSRRSIGCRWYDILGRLTVDGNYGDNGGADINTRADPVPDGTSATALVTTYAVCDSEDDLTSSKERWQYLKKVNGVIRGSTVDTLGRQKRKWTREREPLGQPAKYKVQDFTFDALGHVVTKTLYQDDLPATTQLPPEGDPSNPSTTAFDWGVTRDYVNGNWNENLISSTALLYGIRRPDPGTGNPSTSYARKFVYNMIGEQKAVWWNNKTSGGGSDAFVGRKISHDELGRKITDEVKEGYTIGPHALSWDYNTLGRIVSAQSLNSASTVLNQVKIEYGPWGEVSHVRQSHSGIVTEGTEEDPTTTPYANCEYEGPGIVGGHSIRRRRDLQVFYKENAAGDGTEYCSRIDYDYGDAEKIDNMLSRPAYYDFKRFPGYQNRVYEYFMGVNRWVMSLSQKEDSGDYISLMVQQITNYKQNSNTADPGFNRFGRVLKYKSKPALQYPFRREWSYYSDTGERKEIEDYRRETSWADEEKVVYKKCIYDDFGKNHEENFKYCNPSVSSVWEIDNRYSSYDGLGQWNCYNKDLAEEYEDDCHCC